MRLSMFSAMTNWDWVNEIEIPSSTAAGRQLVEDLLAALKVHEWAEHDVFGIHLAFEEALVNAIKHGNGLDETKKVQVNCRLNAEQLVIQITDEGDGFDPMDVPDPTLDENLEAPSGRGLMLMRSFMSTVEYNESGNSVQLVKDRSDDEE